jgi:uncharacterized protein (DUF927 family)
MERQMSKPNAPQVAKLANAEDELTRDAYEIFEFRTIGGKTRRHRVERDRARDINHLRNLLIRKNADLPYNEDDANQIVTKALTAEPKTRIIYAARLGWRRDRRRFVTPRGTIGKTRNVKIRPPLWLNDKQHVEIERSGTVTDWIKRIAEPCGFSDSAMVAISTVFAAPLLEFVGLQSFGINLFGKSKVGKTAELLAAASAIGIRRESQLPNLLRPRRPQLSSLVFSTM